MFVVKNDDGRNDHKRYKSIYFNYFFTCYYRVRLFLAMQVRVMAACMESQADILECAASAQSSRREVMVCFSPMSMELLYLLWVVDVLRTVKVHHFLSLVTIGCP